MQPETKPEMKPKTKPEMQLVTNLLLPLQARLPAQKNMFKHSFFYKYLSSHAGKFLLYIFLRLLSALLTVATLVLVAPMFSLLFGTIAGTGITSATDTLGNTALMQELMSFLSRILDITSEHLGMVKTLIVVAGVFALIFLLKNVFDYLGLRVYTPIRTGAVEKTRNDLYKRILILPLSFFSKNKRGDLLSRMGSDIQEIDETILKPTGTLYLLQHYL